MKNATYKLLLIGDTGVGKTSLMRVFTRQFIPDYDPATVGIDFGLISFKPSEILPPNLLTCYRENEIRLHVWDASGHERFKTLIANYYRNMDAIAIVCDLTNNISVSNVRHWLGDCAKHLETTKDSLPLLFLIANKADLESNVTVEHIESLAEELKVRNLFITSTKESSTIDSSFYNSSFDTIRQILSQLVEKRCSTIQQNPIHMNPVRNSQRHNSLEVEYSDSINSPQWNCCVTM